MASSASASASASTSAPAPAAGPTAEIVKPESMEEAKYDAIKQYRAVSLSEVRGLSVLRPQKIKEHTRMAENLKTGTSASLVQYSQCWSNTRIVRLNIRTLSTDFDKTEDDMKALQSVGQVIGEILKQLDDERCK
jgi:26S proteasome regulatory subunit T4